MRVMQKTSKKLIVALLSLITAFSLLAGFLPQGKTALATPTTGQFTASGGAAIEGEGQASLYGNQSTVTHKQTVTGSTAQGVLIEGARGAQAQYTQTLNLKNSGLDTPLIELVYPKEATVANGIGVPTVYVTITSNVNPNKTITISLSPRYDLAVGPINVKASSYPLSQVNWYNLRGIDKANPNTALINNLNVPQSPYTATGENAPANSLLEDGLTATGNNPVRLYFENKSVPRGNAGIYFGGYKTDHVGKFDIDGRYYCPVRIMSKDDYTQPSANYYTIGDAVDFTDEEATEVSLTVTIAEVHRRIDSTMSTEIFGANSHRFAPADNDATAKILVKSVMGTELAGQDNIFANKIDGVEITSGEGGVINANSPMYLGDNDLLTPFADVYVTPSQARLRADNRYDDTMKPDNADNSDPALHWSKYNPDFEKLTFTLTGTQKTVVITAEADTQANRYRTKLTAEVDGTPMTSSFTMLSFDGENRYSTHLNGSGTLTNLIIHDSLRLYYDAETKAIYTDFGPNNATALQFIIGGQTVYRWKLWDVDLVADADAGADVAVNGVDMSIEAGRVKAGREANFVINHIDQAPMGLTVDYDNADNKLDLKVVGGEDNYTYQFWVKELINTDGNEQNEILHQYTWSLVKDYGEQNSYSLANANMTVGGQEKYIDDKGNYSVIAKVKDGSGQLIDEFYGVYSFKDVGRDCITQIAFDGRKLSDNYAIVTGESSIRITANNGGLDYSVLCRGEVLATNTSGLFEDIFDSLDAGEYTLELKAGSASEFVKVRLLGAYDASQKPVIVDINGVTDTDGSTEFTLTVKNADGSDITEGQKDLASFEFISGGIRAQGVKSLNGGVLQVKFNFTYGENAYGIYNTVVKVFDSSGAKSDEAIFNYYGFTRAASVSQTSNAAASGDKYTSSAGTPITITAEGAQIDGSDQNIQYAFYREDAGGWVLVKNYSTQNSFEWKPLKSGIYNIQIRIKNSQSGSFEALDNKVYVIGDVVLDGSVALNVYAYGGDKTDTGVLTAGRAYVFEAEYVPASGQPQNLMYHFILASTYVEGVYLNYYSPSASFVFVPQRDDTFVITARVISTDTFGFMEQSVTRSLISSIS